MRTELRFADVGEGLNEAVIVRWLAQVGDTVQRDRPIVEVETDKAVVEIPAPVTGVLESQGVPVGGTVRVGEVLAVLEDATSDESRPSFANDAVVPPSVPTIALSE